MEPDQRMVRLSVSDNGQRIEPELLDKIFDPFFTTRQSGLGTGLGLPFIKGIVQSFGGKIEVSSQLGLGTRFEVLLPSVKVRRTVSRFSGEQLARRLKKINPDLPVIIITGNKEWLSRNRLQELGIRSVIAKPFYHHGFCPGHPRSPGLLSA